METERVSGTWNGTKKTVGYTLVKNTSNTNDPRYPMLVIAVMGSKYPADWMVNANSRQKAFAMLLVHNLDGKRFLATSTDGF